MRDWYKSMSATDRHSLIIATIYYVSVYPQ